MNRETMSCINYTFSSSISSLSALTAVASSSFLSSVSKPPPPLVRCCLQGIVAEPKLAEPLLLNAVRGQDVERPPVWLMRQAGRYMKAYQIICEKHPSFRERSENVDLIVEISLQPWKVFQPDGVGKFSKSVLFSLCKLGFRYKLSQCSYFPQLWSSMYQSKSCPLEVLSAFSSCMRNYSKN
uniref:Uroporphyrinogen decarboxylase n=1 Tax=Rhizophora mucronata TaxID=61149 RepID=A0A2P2L7L2_RHIMU